MNSLDTIWRPHPKQALFLACPLYEVMYGGSKGPGKTDALLMDHTGQHLLVHQRWERTAQTNRGRAIFFRKEFGRLKDVINRSFGIFPQLSGGQMKWRDNDHTWFCACGYRVEFGHLEGPRDHEIYHGQEFTRMAVDQVEEIPESQYAYLKAQIRTSDPLLQDTLAVRCAANPLGRHADWVKKRFVDPAPDGLKVITEEFTLHDGAVVTRQRVFIPATLKDNPSLSRDYEATLMDLPEHMRRAFLNGDWNVQEGSFFGEIFDPNQHIIDDLGPTEIRIPSNWPVFRCGDWGSRNPAACYWIAVDNDGLLIVLDELYGPGVEPYAWGKALLRTEEKWGWVESSPPFFSKLTGYLDPSCFKADTSGGPTISERLFEVGLNWYPANNDRKPGWVEVRRRLMERGGMGGKIPGLRICRRCVNLIRTLPNLTSPTIESGGDQDDIDTKLEDHGADALRYGLMSRPIAHLEKDLKEDDINRWERIMLNQQFSQGSDRNRTTGY